MLDCLAMLAHRLCVCIKALLHGLEQTLMLACFQSADLVLQLRCRHPLKDSLNRLI